MAVSAEVLKPAKQLRSEGYLHLGRFAKALERACIRGPRWNPTPRAGTDTPWPRGQSSAGPTLGPWPRSSGTASRHDAEVLRHARDRGEGADGDLAATGRARPVEAFQGEAPAMGCESGSSLVRHPFA